MITLLLLALSFLASYVMQDKITLANVVVWARSKSKCNIIGRECCMGRNYTQLSIEERTMIQMQL
jgi:hypothetical protein